MRDKRHTDHFIGKLLYLINGFRKFNATALTAPTGVNLGFDDPNRPAQLLSNFYCFFGCIGDPAFWHSDPEAPQDFLGLIFMNIHARLAFVNWI